jgi:hypothetical protein
MRTKKGVRSVMENADDPVTKASPARGEKIKRRTIAGAPRGSDPAPDAADDAPDIMPDRTPRDVNDALRSRYPAGDGTVVIASKLQTDLILALYVPAPMISMGPDGQRKGEQVMVADPNQKFRVKGCSVGRGTDFVAKELWGGFALTHGRPSSFFCAWMEQIGQHCDFVKAGLLFAHETPRDTKVHAKENNAERSGTEPLQPPVRDRNGTLVSKPDPRIRSANVLNVPFLEVGSNDGALQG